MLYPENENVSSLTTKQDNATEHNLNIWTHKRKRQNWKTEENEDGVIIQV